MNPINLPYGHNSLSLSLPENWTGGFVESDLQDPHCDFSDMVKEALASPVNSAPLHSLVKKGQRVCIVFADITRSWQMTGTYLSLIADELEKGGVTAENITLLCATGTHRPHSEEEKKILAGRLYGVCRFVDHDCDDQASMVRIGRTSRGTEVEINRLALEADRLIITGGIIFHLMAGYSGGRKTVLPGISSRKTIMQNHSLSLNPARGKGSHPDIGCDKLQNNPLHEDLEEAIDMVKPDFLVNIIPGKKGPGAAVAGHYRDAHRKGCAILREFFKIAIPEKRDLVIASAGGFPADINFYQTVKSMINGCEALNPGGTLILCASCPEGLGNPLMEEMIVFPDMPSREEFLRNNYSIGRFIAYYGCELASRFKILFVSDMNQKDLAPAGILSFPTLQEALDYYRSRQETTSRKYWLIPDASHSFPSVN